MSRTEKQKCPHDGGTCHHECEGECFRYAIGASLSSPFPGYPLPGFENEPPADEAAAERAVALERLRARE